MQNVEFKAELRDLDLARIQCRTLGATCSGRLEQRDTYYKLPDGRLKRREVPGKPPEWIFYHRPDRPSPRMSHFMLYSDDQARTRWGTLPLREWVVLTKSREVWRLDNVRIHLDSVVDLGAFLEFEAEVSRKRKVRECYEQVYRLREAFAPLLGEAIPGGYGEMLDQLRREPIE